MSKLPLLSFLLLCTFSVSAQQIISRTYLERVHFSSNVGISVGKETKKLIEYGLFYQKDVTGSRATELPVKEKRFTGLYVAIPLMVSTEVEFKAQFRGGFIDNDDFSTTPSLHGYYKPAKQVKVGFGIGFRAFVPSLQSSLSVLL